jgi:hypothetical protein
MRLRARKLLKGKDPQDSFLGEIAVWQYLGPEEKRAYKFLVKRGAPFDSETVTAQAQHIRRQKQSKAS